MEHVSVLAYTKKLKNFNFFGASNVRWVNSQHPYTLAKVLRVAYRCCECLIGVASGLSVLRVSYRCCECLIGVASVLSVLRVSYRCCECFIGVASVLSLLRVSYRCCECFIKKQTVQISTSSIYGTSNVCTLFSLLAAGYSLTSIQASCASGSSPYHQQRSSANVLEYCVVFFRRASRVRQFILFICFTI